MPGRKKQRKKKLSITTRKAHARSPHVLAIHKTNEGFILSDGTTIDRDAIDEAIEVELTNNSNIQTTHQFTSRESQQLHKKRKQAKQKRRNGLSAKHPAPANLSVPGVQNVLSSKIIWYRSGNKPIYNLRC